MMKLHKIRFKEYSFFAILIVILSYLIFLASPSIVTEHFDIIIGAYSSLTIVVFLNLLGKRLTIYYKDKNIIDTDSLLFLLTVYVLGLFLLFLVERQFFVINFESILEVIGAMVFTLVLRIILLKL